MGLDQTFYKCKVTKWKAYKEQLEAYEKVQTDEKEDTFEHPGRNFDPEEIGYFRKVNFLMREFAYYGNCEYKEISRDELERLRKKCERLAGFQPRETPEGEEVYSDEARQLASELLPTCSGFFFGSTDYDDVYFQNIHEVLEWVTGVLNALGNDDVVLIYCWW